MIRWLCGVSKKDGTREKLRKFIGVKPIIAVIRSGRIATG